MPGVELQLPWPHAPAHRLAAQGTYFVSAGTYLKAHRFLGASRLRELHRCLLTVAHDHGWTLEAWAVFSNHYHFVAHSPRDAPQAVSLPNLVKDLHARTGVWVNGLDGTPARQVWFNYWETRLTYSGSYFARLNYTHQNAVKHGLVRVANQYPWCSAAWFERSASAAQVETIYRLRWDRVRSPDPFDPGTEW